MLGNLTVKDQIDRLEEIMYLETLISYTASCQTHMLLTAIGEGIKNPRNMTGWDAACQAFERYGETIDQNLKLLEQKRKEFRNV